MRALVVRGEGRGFCAGRDLADAEPLDEDGEAILNDSLNPVVDPTGPSSRRRRSVRSTDRPSGPASASRSRATSSTPPTTLGSAHPSRASARCSTPARTTSSCDGSAPTARSSSSTPGGMLSGPGGRGVGHREPQRRSARSPGPHARAMARQVATGPTAAFVASKQLVWRMADDGLVVRRRPAGRGGGSGRRLDDARLPRGHRRLPGEAQAELHRRMSARRRSSQSSRHQRSNVPHLVDAGVGGCRRWARPPTRRGGPGGECS